MKLIPQQKLMLITNYTFEEVLELLNTNSASNSYLTGFGGKARPFKGVINGNNFKLIKNTIFRNPFNPCIKGKVIPFLNYTHILVTFRLQYHHAFLIVIILTVTGFLSLYFLAFANTFEITLLLFPAIFTVVALTISNGFKNECNEAANILKLLLNAQTLPQ